MTDIATNETIGQKLGWTCDEDGKWFSPKRQTEPWKGGYTGVPDYYNSIEAVWEIVNYLVSKQFTVSLMSYPDGSWSCVLWEAGSDKARAVEMGTSAPMSICKVFLALHAAVAA